MSKTEYDILAERLADKDDDYALAYMLTYAHAKALNTPGQFESGSSDTNHFRDTFSAINEHLQEIAPTHTFEDAD